MQPRRIAINALLLISSFFVEAASSKTVIDARDGVTKKVIEQYHSLVDGDSPVVRGRVTILIDARKGFDVGVLLIRRKVRLIDLRITVRVYRGGRVRGDIVVNHLELTDPKTIFRINQFTRVI